MLFYIAYGTHPKQTDKESLRSYGETFKAYEFIHHDCHDESNFEMLGYTNSGTPIKIRKDILSTDLIITVGAISHHYFAGFGGGRKLIFPGLGSADAIYKNHSLFLDADKKHLHKACYAGNLKDNPLARDLKEYLKYMPNTIQIHGILNSKGELCQTHIGASYSDFERACEQHDKLYSVPVKKQYNAVLASAGGQPKDINFIQSHKAIHNASAFVKNGGTLYILAMCKDGIGSQHFLEYFKLGSYDEVFKHLTKQYSGNGGTALSLMEKTNRIKIKLVSHIDDNTCSLLKIEKISQQQLSKEISDMKDEIALIPNASMLVTTQV